MKTVLSIPVAVLAFTVAAALRGDDQANSPSSRAPDRHGANRPQLEQEMETAAFLGVETTLVSETLTEQLNLPKNFGLVVLHISPDSPASAALLKPNDILLKLDDQRLVDTLQLAALITRPPGRADPACFPCGGKGGDGQGQADPALGSQIVGRIRRNAELEP